MRHNVGLMGLLLVACGTSHQSRPAEPQVVTPKSPDLIVEIRLKRGPCFGTCPVYEFILRRNGESEYHGGSWAIITGEYRGVATPSAFNGLAARLLRAGFFALPDTVTVAVTDLASSLTTVVLADGTQKSVYVYGYGNELIASINRLVDSVGGMVPWRAVQ